MTTLTTELLLPTTGMIAEQESLKHTEAIKTPALERKVTSYHPKKRGETPCWLSLELRLDDFDIKHQTFTISGWINVFWVWHKAPERLKCYKGKDPFQETCANDSNPPNEEKNSKSLSDITDISDMKLFVTNEGEEVVKVLDLRKSSLSYYLPIDANKIFFLPSLQYIQHIDAPFLMYNKVTHTTHTQYYIKAYLCEHLELFLYPFDQQFLNVKFRWNSDYYRILDFVNDKDIPIAEQWFGAKGANSERKKLLYHHLPLKIQLKESLQNEVEMFSAWIDFRDMKLAQDKDKNEYDNKLSAANLRFALIRLRVRRSPMYFVANVLFPFFIIVSASFSVFAIDREDIGDRLGVSVTILLTFTAFQSVVAEQLPETSKMLLVDCYITTAYGLQALLIAATAIIATLDNDIAASLDMLSAVVFGAVWVLFSVFYMSLKFDMVKNCYDKIHGCFCFCCWRKASFGDWKKRAREELEEWANVQKKVYHFDPHNITR